MFAAWGYSWFKIEPEIDKAIVENFLEIIAPYWAPQNRLLWDQYRDVDIPLRKIDLPSPEMVVTWDLEELFAYLHTWSATRRCMDGIGSEFFYDAFDKLQPLWGDVHLKRKVTMDFCLVASKNDR